MTSPEPTVVLGVIGELLVEVIGESILVALNGTLGIGMAAATYWLWLAVRRRLWRLDRPVVAETPDGMEWVLEVPGLRLRTPISRRIFQSEDARRAEAAPTARDADRLHPRRMGEALDSVLIFVAPFVLVGVVLFVLVFLLELLVAVVVLGVVSVVGSVVRHRWTCEITGPTGRVIRVQTRGLRQVRRRRDQLAELLRVGEVAAVEAASRGQD